MGEEKGTPLSAWYPILDDLAEQANADYTAAKRTRGSGAPSIAWALASIASQLQYGNAIAVADFYLRHTGKHPEEDA